MSDTVIQIIIFGTPVFLIVAIIIAGIAKREAAQELDKVKKVELEQQWEIIELKNKLDTQETLTASILLAVKKFGCPTCSHYRDGEKGYPCRCCTDHEKWQFTWKKTK